MKISSNQIESVKEFFSKELETELAKELLRLTKLILFLKSSMSHL